MGRRLAGQPVPRCQKGGGALTACLTAAGMGAVARYDDDGRRAQPLQPAAGASDHAPARRHVERRGPPRPWHRAARNGGAPLALWHLFRTARVVAATGDHLPWLSPEHPLWS